MKSLVAFCVTKKPISSKSATIVPLFCYHWHVLLHAIVEGFSFEVCCNSINVRAFLESRIYSFSSSKFQYITNIWLGLIYSIHSKSHITNIQTANNRLSCKGCCKPSFWKIMSNMRFQHFCIIKWQSFYWKKYKLEIRQGIPKVPKHWLFWALA